MKAYEELEIEIIVFDAEDVIVTSGNEEAETASTSYIELPFVPTDQL
jgi:hypothetical protein